MSSLVLGNLSNLQVFLHEYARQITLITNLFSEKYSKYRSEAGLHPDALGKLTALPQAPYLD